MLLRAVLALIALSVPAAHACTAIRFARGASSATVRGEAGSDEPFPCFTFAAAAGQTARVRLVRAANGNIAFNVLDVVDNRYEHTFRTQARTYQIDVYQMGVNRRPLPFTLEVSVR